MTSHPYECDYCGQAWRNPISAALCCDVVSNDLDDDVKQQPARTA